ncbi:MAG: hypothetical protein HY700_17330 [Gemmatimonadetes bacterium]|nr:hypothetical protein [Gemmatimonadota bacterium]
MTEQQLRKVRLSDGTEALAYVDNVISIDEHMRRISDVGQELYDRLIKQVKKPVTITREEASDGPTWRRARDRALAAGVKLVIEDEPGHDPFVPPPPRPGIDVILTREQANDHALYQLASAKAQKRGGTVRVAEDKPYHEKIGLTKEQAADPNQYEAARKAGEKVETDRRQQIVDALP